MTSRISRVFLTLCAAAAIAAPAASAQNGIPLTGKGENMQPIARVAIPSPNEIEIAGDWAFVSNDGSVDDTGGGLWIVNIKDPSHPFVEGKWICPAGWGDVDVSPDANLVVLTNAHGGQCTDDDAQDVIIDTSDKKHPKLASVITDPNMTYVHTSTLDNGGKTLLMNPQTWVGYPAPGNTHIARYDISNPKTPKLLNYIEKPEQGANLAHDTYVDHRPDGKTLLYAASVHSSDVFDITDPMAYTWLQSVYSPEITISHDVQPNYKRDVLVVDDEGAAGGQLDENVGFCGKVGADTGPASYDSGAVHFYQEAADGTFFANGATELGSFAPPVETQGKECVAHVFWQAPDQNRLTQAYYRQGMWAIDFSDPANPKSFGHFKGDPVSGADDTMYWSAKPHRGYVFGTNMLGSLDIIRYTGEGGKAWPATSGPAEMQRSARQGVPYAPLTLENGSTDAKPLPGANSGADTRSIGAIKFTAKLRKLKGKKAKISFTFVDAKGKTVGTLKISKKVKAKKAKVSVYGAAVVGSYKWTAKVGKKVVGKGKLTVKKTAGTALAPNKTLSVGAR